MSIYNSGYHTDIIKNTIFSNNNGGLSVGIIADHSENVIHEVKFSYNSVAWYRGASLSTHIRFINTVIIQNTAFMENNYSGLQLYLSENDVLWTLIKYTTFLLNFGTDGKVGGAGIIMFSNGCSYNRSLLIHNTIFNGNTEVALQFFCNPIVKVTAVDITKTVSNIGSHEVSMKEHCD